MEVGTPEDWVHDAYKLQTWSNVYSHKINPMNGRDMWSKVVCPTTLLPHKQGPKAGRPFKKRKKSKGEIEMVKGHKLSRKGKTVTCSNCKELGHNKRGCKKTGSRGGQIFDMTTREPMESQQTASQTVASQSVGPSTQVSGLGASPLKRTNLSALRLNRDPII